MRSKNKFKVKINVDLRINNKYNCPISIIVGPK